MRVTLIGNYGPDAQQSMLRYSELLRTGLVDAGHEVHVAAAQPVLNARRRAPTGLWKWVGHLDKYVFGLADIRKATGGADIVHVCDHSNAVYLSTELPVPQVVTCHDLLAVRGARGEDTDCPASMTGKLLQK